MVVQTTRLDRDIFKELNEIVVSKARIGNGAHMAMKGKETIAIEEHSSLKLIYDVLYVHELNQKLLSVTQLWKRLLRAS